MDFPSWWLKRTIQSWLLWPFAFLFGVIAQIRFFFYRKNIFSTYSSQLPIIIVGNISVGGTGKTPFVIALANELKKQGMRPAIVSRGYRSQSKQFPLLVELTTPVELAGDEPLMIVRQTACPVVIDPKRVRAVKFLEKNQQCDVIICDDGLQHYALNRDVEIVIVDGVRQFGNGFLLPAGMLRESIARLSKADIVISSNEIKNIDKLNVKTFYKVEYAINELCSVADPQCKADITYFQDKEVYAVAGIGNPERFFALLRTHALKVLPHPFSDHYSFKPEDFNFQRNHPLPLIMTEKDAVKCHSFSLRDAWYVEISAVLPSELVATIIEKLKNRMEPVKSL